MMTTALQNTLDKIDAENRADPNTDNDSGEPVCLLYGQRMSAELEHLYPGARDLLQIAARGQHIQRWKLLRNEYPEGRAGYLAWRKAQGVFHAERVAQIMRDNRFSDADCETVSALLRKEGLKQNPETQKLEDVICFVFLRWYFADFAKKHSGEAITRIVSKTARKMSPNARTRAITEFSLPQELAELFAP